MRREVDPCIDDLQRRVGDLQVDEHVVHRQRLGIVVEVQTWWLLIADRAADEQPIVGEAVGADPILAIVEDVEAVRVRGDDGVGAEHGHCRTRPRAVVSTRDTVNVIDPFTLHGQHVELVPLVAEHAAELAAAAAGDRSSYEYTEVPSSVEHAVDYIGRLLAQRDAGTAVPFAQRRVADGRLVGCTRFMELRRWRGRDEPDEVEIGGTWLAPDAQRSPINTEAKLLLLVHAFDVWQVTRVALATDVRNERSRRAIERIGARFEGTLRHHRPSLSPGRGRPGA